MSCPCEDMLYTVTFTASYTEYEGLTKECEDEKDRKYWKRLIDDNPGELENCKKWEGRRIRLCDIPTLMKECKHPLVVFEETIEVYNDYRE